MTVYSSQGVIWASGIFARGPRGTSGVGLHTVYMYTVILTLRVFMKPEFVVGADSTIVGPALELPTRRTGLSDAVSRD